MNTDDNAPAGSQAAIPGKGLSWFDKLLVFQFGVILVIMTVAIIFRYVINQSLSWSDEAVRYLFVWFTLLGSSLALRDKAHIQVEFFIESVPPRLRRLLDFLSDSLVLAFNVVLFFLGVKWFFATAGMQTASLHLPINLVLYGALPASALLNIVFLLLSGKAAENEPGPMDSH